MEGLGVLALALGVYALLFDDPAGSVVAGMIALFILFRAVFFRRAVSALVRSVAVERTAGKRIVRQGVRLPVKTLVTYDASLPLVVGVEDILPAIAVLDGEQSVDLQKPGRLSIRYVLRPMAAGDTSFGGLVLSVRDPFFSGILRVGRPALCSPSLRVVPGPVHDPGSGRGLGEGTSSEGGQSLLSSADIRGFHAYIPGEDLTRIDWKLSAKFGFLYVREYEGESNGAPLLVIDLPDLHDAPEKEDFARFSIAASGEAEGIYTQFDACPLLIISGGDVLTFLDGSLDQKEFLGAIATIRPVERSNYFYRLLDRTDVRVGVRAPSGGDGEVFRERLASVIRVFGDKKEVLPFRSAVARAMRLSGAATVVIYTTGRGDCSHLSQIVFEAYHQGLGVCLRVPAEAMKHVRQGIGAGSAVPAEVI